MGLAIDIDAMKERNSSKERATFLRVIGKPRWADWAIRVHRFLGGI